MSDELVLIDSNLLSYVFDESEPEKRKICNELVHVLNYNAQTIKSAIGISSKHGIHYWDALLAATMKENNVFSIYTENEKDFKKIPWLKTINPLD